LGDLDPAHPYYDIMPPFLQEAEFVRFRSVDNCYDAEPVIGPADFVQPANDVTGMVADEDHVVLAAADIASLFVDTDSYVRDFANPATCGSRVTINGAVPPPDPDPGDPDDPSDPNDPDDPSDASGCGCHV